MTKQILTIEDYEDKKTKTGKIYTRFKTDGGWMSCFNAKASEELKKLKGNQANVETIQSGEYTNIKSFIGQASEEVEIETEKVKGKNHFKKEMYVSYAKDCFCAIVTRISQAKFDDFKEEDILKLMDISLNVVKKAEEAFD